MSISFGCDCGHTLVARDELAGRKTRCPHCGTVLVIPPPETLSDDDVASLLSAPGPVLPKRPTADPRTDDEYAVGPSSHSAERPVASPPVQPLARESVPAKSNATTKSTSRGSPSSIREYTYLLLGFALIPLLLSLLVKGEKVDINERIKQTLQDATPEQLARAIPVLTRESGVGPEELFAVLPEGRLAGAHLARDSRMHWVYAGIAAVGFLLLTLGFFSIDRVNPLALFATGLFTGTVGIILLLGVQFCSQFRFGTIRGRGWIVLILLILAFIGWSYRSADDPDSNFILSAMGFTFGVGLCEELTKALPLLFLFGRHSDRDLGWRGGFLYGLASGIGFGVSEGVMYAGDSYNGLGGVDIYVIRFVSCVALHAMWAGSVGVAIARRRDDYEAIQDAGGVIAFGARVLAVPIVLHGFYDTLLKQDHNLWAVIVAVASFGWMAVQVELARGADQPARRLAY